MNNIHILDCTLRDGGYCNEWRFGFENAKKITHGLVEAGIDIIECGFITNKVDYDSNVTKVPGVAEMTRLLPENRDGKLFVAMINYGEFDADDLPCRDENTIDGIRVAFHKSDLVEAIEFCKQIKDKGYLVFVQAMVSLSYTDEEFLELIHMANELRPYAFYIVDSFGMMKGKDLTRLFYMVEHNLDEGIWIGFHSHNNMQLAYSNAQQLTTVETNRDIILDSSVYGMGRGAGNLNTELFLEYLNENVGKDYRLKPLLTLIDEILDNFYQQSYWGYSLPNYISAAHDAHPNYAGYLNDKKTLTVEGMNDIFDMMSVDKKVEFDKDYVEELYVRYMDRGRVQEIHRSELEEALKGKRVLLVAPGMSSISEASRIREFCDGNTVIISVNHSYDLVDTDYIFVSNSRRFRELTDEARAKSIVTSNIPPDGTYYQTSYRDLTNQEEAVNDNAGLMAIRFFMEYEVEGIYLAGFDGYSHDSRENYGNSQLAFVTRNAVLDAMNEGMSKVLCEYARLTKIEFLTSPHYVRIEE